VSTSTLESIPLPRFPLDSDSSQALSRTPADPVPHQASTSSPRLPWAIALVAVGVAGFALGRGGSAAEPAAAAAPQTAVMAVAPTEPALELPAAQTEAAPDPGVTPADAGPSSDDVALAAAEPTDLSLAAAEPAGEPAPATEPKSAPAGAGQKTTGQKKSRKGVVASLAPAPAPGGIDATAATQVLRRISARAMSCSDPQGGKISLSVTFQPDGTVGSADVLGPYAATRAGNCVLTVFRTATVQPFTGKPFTTFWSFDLPGDGKPING
jgi:hypothetical protein